MSDDESYYQSTLINEAYNSFVYAFYTFDNAIVF